MAQPFPYSCDVNDCSIRGTFISADRQVVACTRHARKGFTVYPNVVAIAMGRAPVYYREGLGNLYPVSAIPA